MAHREEPSRPGRTVQAFTSQKTPLILGMLMGFRPGVRLVCSHHAACQEPRWVRSPHWNIKMPTRLSQFQEATRDRDQVGRTIDSRAQGSARVRLDEAQLFNRPISLGCRVCDGLTGYTARPTGKAARPQPLVCGVEMPSAKYVLNS